MLEAYTLQVLPNQVQTEAIECIAKCLTGQGSLLVICGGRDPRDDPGQMPWPLNRDTLGHFTRLGLRAISFEDYVETEDPPVRRFRAEYRRP